MRVIAPLRRCLVRNCFQKWVARVILAHEANGMGKIPLHTPVQVCDDKGRGTIHTGGAMNIHPMTFLEQIVQNAGRLGKLPP